MFRTYAAAEVSVSVCQDNQDTAIATVVDVLDQCLWFIGTLADEKTGGRALHTVLVRDLDQLFVVGRNRMWELIQVDLAIPASETPTGELEFERLVSAWECEDLRYPDGIARLYCSILGASYADVIPPLKPFDESKLRRIRRIYPTPRARSEGAVALAQSCSS